MLAEPRTIVYVETNWVVSLFYPYRANHSDARDLLERAKRGDVSLRIPYGCLLEAVHAIESAGQDAMQVITKATEYITSAQRNGESSLDAVVRPLLGSTAFLAKDPKPFLDLLRMNPHIGWLSSTTDELLQLDQVRSQVRFRGKDKFDLYIIATVLADRSSAGHAIPAVFCSENKAEFEPKSAGPSFTGSPRPAGVKMAALPPMPDDLYRQARLIWRSDYQVLGALVEWNTTFGAGASAAP